MSDAVHNYNYEFTFHCCICRGTMPCSHKHYSENFGLSIQRSYCSYKFNCAVAKMSGMVRIEFGNETDLQTTLGTVGPISVTIDGSSKPFRVSKEKQGRVCCK